MSAKRLSQESITDSAYARELRRGSANMRFEASLEADYRTSHVRRVRRRVRIWHSVHIAMVFFFTSVHIQHAGIWNAISFAHVCGLVPCALTLVWLTWSRLYERLYLRLAWALVAVSGTLIAAIVAAVMTKGVYEPLASLMLIVFGTFFFAGLMFRQAVLANCLTLLGFAFGAYAARLPLLEFARSIAIMTLSSGLAAIVYRDMEQSYRRNFLEAALIAELAVRDGLSGIRNRRAFDQHLDMVWNQGIRDGRSLAIFMIDIDHFKGFNDRLGHREGDRALRAVAEVLQRFARRPLDLAARYGGDEFAVILYDLEFLHAQCLAEDLREAVQNLAIQTQSSTGPQVTVSVGVGFAVADGGQPNADGVLQLADEALYAAKRAGRNCIIAKGGEPRRLLDTGSFDRANQCATPEQTP